MIAAVQCFQLRADECVDRLRPVHVGQPVCIQRAELSEGLDRGFQDLAVKALLAAEMIVDRRLIGLRRLGDLADRAAFKTLRREDGDCCF